MKCVRCGASTNSETSFCENCEDFIKNGGTVEEESNYDFDINWGYMLVTISVIAVAIMLAVIVYCVR